jgi:hypothetical protein
MRRSERNSFILLRGGGRGNRVFDPKFEPVISGTLSHATVELMSSGCYWLYV